MTFEAGGSAVDGSAAGGRLRAAGRDGLEFFVSFVTSVWTAFFTCPTCRPSHPISPSPGRAGWEGLRPVPALRDLFVATAHLTSAQPVWTRSGLQSSDSRRRTSARSNGTGPAAPFSSPPPPLLFYLRRRQ